MQGMTVSFHVSKISRSQWPGDQSEKMKGASKHETKGLECQGLRQCI